MKAEQKRLVLLKAEEERLAALNATEERVTASQDYDDDEFEDIPFVLPTPTAVSKSNLHHESDILFNAITSASSPEDYDHDGFDDIPFDGPTPTAVPKTTLSLDKGERSDKGL